MNPQGNRPPQVQQVIIRPDAATHFLKRAAEFTADGPHIGADLFRDVTPENFHSLMRQIETRSKEMSDVNVELRSNEMRAVSFVDSFVNQGSRILQSSTKLFEYEAQESKLSQIRNLASSVMRNLSTADEIRGVSKRQRIRKDVKTIHLSIAESLSSKFDTYVAEVKAKKDLLLEVTNRKNTFALVQVTLPFVLEAIICFDLSSDIISVDYIQLLPLSKTTDTPLFTSLNDNAIQYISSISRFAKRGIFHFVMKFIESHRNLFSATCPHCKKILHTNVHSKLPMPPTLRAFGRIDTAEHPECVPQIDASESNTDFIVTYTQ